MNQRQKQEPSTNGDTPSGSAVFECMPTDIPVGEAGQILKYARNELDVSHSQIIQSSNLGQSALETFEGGGQSLSRSLWKSYVLGVCNRHEITIAKASGLLKGLVKEIIFHEDHKRPSSF